MKTFEQFINEVLYYPKLTPTHVVIANAPYYMNQAKIQVGDLVHIKTNDSNPSDVTNQVVTTDSVFFMKSDLIKKHFRLLTPVEIKSHKYGI